MVKIRLNVTAKFDNSFSITERGIEVDVTKFLTEKMSMTEEELNFLARRFGGKHKINYVLNLLKFYTLLEEQFRDSYLESFFNQQIFPQFIGKQNLQVKIFGRKIIVEDANYSKTIQSEDVDTTEQQTNSADVVVDETEHTDDSVAQQESEENSIQEELDD